MALNDWWEHNPMWRPIIMQEFLIALHVIDDFALHIRTILFYFFKKLLSLVLNKILALELNNGEGSYAPILQGSQYILTSNGECTHAPFYYWFIIEKSIETLHPFFLTRPLPLCCHQLYSPPFLPRHYDRHCWFPFSGNDYDTNFSSQLHDLWFSFKLQPLLPAQRHSMTPMELSKGSGLVNQHPTPHKSPFHVTL